MASNLFYNLLPEEPAADIANRDDLIREAAQRQQEAMRGDGNPLPPPFTYGKIYRNGTNNKATEKLPTAPSLSRKDFKKLLNNLPKPTTQVDLNARPVGAAAIPQDPPREPMGLLEQARAVTRKKQTKKIIKRLRENLNSKVINRQTSVRSELGRARKNQDTYEWLIKLTTNLTGKHSIFYSSKLTTQQSRQRQGERTPKQTIQDLPAGVEYPTLKRTEKTPPYGRPRNKKNEEWMRIAKEIDERLPSLFHEGNELAFPNPLYPDQIHQDKIFRISSYSLEFLPKKMRYLVSDNNKQDRFKFYITHNPKKPVTRGNIAGDPYLYVVTHVRLIGKWIKDRNTIEPARALPASTATNKDGSDISKTSKCDKKMKNIRDAFHDIWSQTGIFRDSAKMKFDKKMKKAKNGAISATNLRLFAENKTKAIAYWEQEYYCRQAMNFNAGIDAGWPNITAAAATRFPFDPWTLQPGVPATFKIVNYIQHYGAPVAVGPAGPPLNSANSPNLANCFARYNAAGINVPSTIPFAPFGMSLKPKMIEILFKRIENMLNANAAELNAVAPPIPAPVINAAANLRGLRIRGKLPRLTRLTRPQIREMFNLYEYALYHDYGNANREFKWPSPILEPYRSYPELPAPPAGNNYGRWVINKNGNTQFAIPVETNPITAPWGPAALAPAENPGAAVPARHNVTWQQVKANNFYKKEAKKWAEWMILAHPFPIPGFPIYADYIYLRQKYILRKLAQVTRLAVPAAAQPFFPPLGGVLGDGLTPVQQRGQFKLPAFNAVPAPAAPLGGQGIQFGPRGTNNLAVRRGEAMSRAWILFYDNYRTNQYNNPYSSVSAMGGHGWDNIFSLLFLEATPWNQNKELFVGQEANKFPTEVWPSNNMKRARPNDVPAWPAAPWRNYFRTHVGGAMAPQQIFPALMDMNMRNSRQVKRQNMGGWSGGRKRTLKKKKKKRRRRTLKKKRKKR